MTGRAVSGARYFDHAIDLTGDRYAECLFDGCVLTLHPDDQTSFVGCRFISCELVGDGWIMMGMYVGRPGRYDGPPNSRAQFMDGRCELDDGDLPDGFRRGVDPGDRFNKQWPGLQWFPLFPPIRRLGGPGAR